MNRIDLGRGWNNALWDPQICHFYLE